MGSLNAIAGPTVYLDANVLIYAVENAPILGDRLRPVFQQIDAGKLQGTSSELSLAETLVRPLREGDRRTASEYQQLLAPAGRLTVIPVSRAVLVEAARLRAAQSSLKLPDAIHAATALLHGCTTFLTNDTRFESVPQLPVLLLSRMT